MNKFLTVILLFLTSNLIAQVKIKGNIIDAVSKNPVVNAHIQNEQYSTLTYKNGDFEILLPEQKWKEEIIIITFVGYDTLKITVGDYWSSKKSFPQFELFESSIVLAAQNITAPLPDTVHGSDTYSIHDYDFIDDNLILITYDIRLKKGTKLRLIDHETDEQLSEYFLTKTPQKFFRDFQDVLYLINEDGSVHQIDVKREQILLSNVDEEIFNRSILPVDDSLNLNLFFSTYQEKYPAFDYFAYNLVDTGYTKMKTIEDKIMMEMYLAEYKYMDVRTKLWAFQQEVNTGIDKEIWIGANFFTNSLYYEKIYSPLFIAQDSIYIFDHYNDRIYNFSNPDTQVDSIAINYHLKPNRTGWDKLLIQDRVNETIHSVFYKNSITTLSKINLNTGLLDGTFELHFKYAENHKIINGYVYYIYHPFESPQKKFLYKEAITY